MTKKKDGVIIKSTGKSLKTFEEDFMKKLKVLSLILAIVIIAATFFSCGAKVSPITSLERVFNKDYKATSAPVTSIEALTNVNGDTFVKANEYFAVFKGAIGEDGLSATYKVYSFATNTFVYTVSSSATRGYEIELYDGIPAFVLKELTLSLDPSISLDIDPKCSLYDVAGNMVVSYSENVGDPTRVADMYVYNSVAYVETEEGTLEKKMDVPEYLMLGNITDYNEKYIYAISENIVVYNKDLEVESFWNAPGYAEDIEYFILNNGDILVQYTLRLDDMAKKYDIFEVSEAGAAEKYDLVSLVIKASNGNEKEVDLDYIIEFLSPNYELYDEEDENNMFTSKFQNLARVSYIVDGRIDETSVRADIVTMDNKGAIKNSVKIADAQIADLPAPVSSGVYAARTTYGIALVNARGKVIKAMNNTAISIRGDYIVSDTMIYNFNMESVYNLKENKATVIGEIGSTLYIEAENNETSTVIMAIRDGNPELVCTKTADNGISFAIKDNMECYEIHNSVAGDYKYYTSEGTMLTASTTPLTAIATSFDGKTILVSDGAVGSYSILKK